MTYNQNEADYDFYFNSKEKTLPAVKLYIEDEKTLNKLKLLKSEDSIIIYAEKINRKLASIYLFNNTNDSINISISDSRFRMIQEAKDKDGKWKPIEYWNYSACGSSYSNFKLKPNGILKANSKLYRGSFKTKIRFKILSKNKVYYTNELDGEINPKQFKLEKELHLYIRQANASYKFFSKESIRKYIFIEPDGVEKIGEDYKKWQEWLEQK